MNKKLAISAVALAAVFTLASGMADAGRNRHSFEDQARVLRVKPIYETISTPETERHCREGYRRTDYRDYDSMTGTIAGGIIGGIIGNSLAGMRERWR